MCSWFHSKKNRANRLLEGMTDLHTHLLPGVDDGVETLEESLRTLAFLQELGVERIFLTPHVMTDLQANTPEALYARYRELQKDSPSGLELRLAAEYMLDAGFISLMEKGLLAMPNKHVLVETSYLSPPPNFMTLLYDLTLAGYIPIIAHPERYLYMRENNDYRKLKDKGYKLQLNLFSLAGVYGIQAERNAVSLLKQGLYDHVGSDIHQLEAYQESLAYLSPTGSQFKELERLVANNKALG
jgi:tyrosine-protein phosphatase YwqE